MTDKNPICQLTRKWPSRVEKVMGDHCEILINEEDEPMGREDLVAALCSSEILCPTVTDSISAEVFALAEEQGLRTKLLANFGVGFNHIDIEQASRLGIAVTNTPGVLTDATAEISMALLLMCARRTGEGERLVRSGAWDGWRPTHMLSTQVTGKALGIIGMGRIGLAMAKKAHHGFGMQIIYSSRSPQEAYLAEDIGATRYELSELLQKSDFVSLHCPSTPETKHLIDQEALAIMGSHAFLINTARGEVVDEYALASALGEGEIAGAGLDVYENEPSINPALLKLENLVLLPHMGSGTNETREAMGMCAFDNIKAYLNGAELPNRVV